MNTITAVSIKAYWDDGLEEEVSHKMPDYLVNKIESFLDELEQERYIDEKVEEE